MVKFQVLTWDSRDENNDHYIRLFGKTLEGKSVCVTTTFKPYFFIKIPVGSSQEALKGIIEKKFHEEVYEIEEVEAKDVWGFQNNEKRRFLQVFCNDSAQRRRVSNYINKMMNNQTIKKNL